MSNSTSANNPILPPTSSPLSVVAPKRKRPRQVSENPSYGARSSPSSMDQKPKIIEDGYELGQYSFWSQFCFGKISQRENMSGAGKKIADVAFKAGKTIDWEGMAKLLVSDEARKEFATLRRAFDEVNTQLQTKFSQEPEPIDWEYYRKGIGSRLVDIYKQAYDVSEYEREKPRNLNNENGSTIKGNCE
ncbi:ATP synthase subunit d [Forsythia ovata]|uniref:ATP synthase subunit d n=1 Tax=Forsythia ovata TaxID=205694 RepID=A0ABD1UYI5_9LAMI